MFSKMVMCWHQTDLLDDVADLAAQFHCIHVLDVFSIDQDFTGQQV